VAALAPFALIFDRRVSGWHYRVTRDILRSCPPVLQDALGERYAAISGEVRHHYASGGGRVQDTWGDAAADLMTIGRQLQRVKPQTAFDDDAIEAAADRAARFCMTVRTPAAVEYAERQGLVMPEGVNVTERGLRRRLVSPDWWRRRLRTTLTRACEELFRRLGFVRAQTSAYVSGDALTRVRLAAIKSQQWMRETAAVCEDTGEVLRLDEIAQHSVANPTLRRGELMMRARGFQEVAALRADRCVMVTATCPSAFHPWLRDSGAPNPQYNGSTPREAQAWLNQHWARARAALKREKVLYYGFRAAEPHHDATPHWHLVLYTENVAAVIRILTKVWLKDYADEPGATQHRVKFTEEDAAKGSGVGYLAKYVAKNIDGAGSIGAEVSDESGRRLSDDAQHAIAWARIHGIRQFQQCGGPAVTLWRELRRVREPCEWPPLEVLRLCTDNRKEGPGESQSTSFAQQADNITSGRAALSLPVPLAQTGLDDNSVSGPSWSRFIAVLGGIGPSLKASRGFWDKQEPRRVDSAGRNVIRLTRWGELPPFCIVGLKIIYRDRIRRLPTHVHVWFLIFSPRSGALYLLGPVATTVRGAAAAGSPRGWTNPQETSQAPPGK
jgi:GNAT superfamily N-acetyltransferase